MRPSRGCRVDPPDVPNYEDRDPWPRPTRDRASGFPGRPSGATPTRRPTRRHATTADSADAVDAEAPADGSTESTRPTSRGDPPRRGARDDRHDRRDRHRRLAPADQVHGRPEPGDADRRRDLARRDDGRASAPMPRPSSRRSTPPPPTRPPTSAARPTTTSPPSASGRRPRSPGSARRPRPASPPRKTGARRRDGQHAPRSSRRASSGSTRPSPTFEAEMAEFFERLLAEEDPTRIATMAETHARAARPGRDRGRDRRAAPSVDRVARRGRR